MQFFQNLSVHISIGYNTATQYHRIRVNHAHQVHNKIGKSLGSILHQYRTKRISLLAECKDFTDKHPFPLFCRDVQAGLILVAKQTGTVVEPNTGSNDFHTVHPAATTLDTDIHTDTYMTHFTGIKMTASYLPAVHHRTYSKTGTHIHIDEVLGDLTESPHPFGSCGTLHVIVYMTRHTVCFLQFLSQSYRLCATGVNLQPDPLLRIDATNQTDSHAHRFLAIPTHGTDIIVKRRFNNFQCSLLVKIPWIILLIP